MDRIDVAKIDVAKQGPAPDGVPALGFDYAPAPESRSVVEIAPSYGLFIGGDWVEPDAGSSRFETVNPATEEVLSQVTAAGPADVERAVAAARTAYDTVWSKLSGTD